MDAPVYGDSLSFAIRIVKLYRHLVDVKKEFVLSKQLLRSGTSIGANLREAKFAQSKNDFIAKCSIALKEAGETQYWPELLYQTDFLTEKEYESISTDCNALVAMLVSTVKNTKSSPNSF